MLICSAFFYLTFSPIFLLLFLILILLNYFLGLGIEKVVKKKKLIFWIGILLNISVLAAFKYYDALSIIRNDIKVFAGNDPVLKIIFPVGLSFFAFTVIGYLADIKRTKIKAEKHLGILAASLLFFPKILMGPIEKPSKVSSQLRQGKSFNHSMVGDGLKLILWGYFKKLVVADRLAIYVNYVYDNYEDQSGISLLVATIFYAFQIYTDFSGYSDIAVGSAKVLGINLSPNFLRPYFSSSVREFCTRWHVSLYAWFRDYIFQPLVELLSKFFKKRVFHGVIGSKWILAVTIIVTTIAYGAWHGKFNFLIWGLIFGTYLVVESLLNDCIKRHNRISIILKGSIPGRVLGRVMTMSLVTFAWIFFRAEEPGTAMSIIGRIFTFNGSLYLDTSTILYGLTGLSILFFVEAYREFKESFHLPFKTINRLTEIFLYSALSIIILLIGVLDGADFIYSRF